MVSKLKPLVSDFSSELINTSTFPQFNILHRLDKKQFKLHKIQRSNMSPCRPEFLCVSAVLETAGLSPDWLPLLQPRLLRMLAPCHLDSWSSTCGLADGSPAGEIHGCHINNVFIGRQMEDLRSLSASCRCRTSPTVENVDTILFTQTDPFTVVFVKHATLSWLGIQDDSVSFMAHL